MTAKSRLVIPRTRVNSSALTSAATAWLLHAAPHKTIKNTPFPLAYDQSKPLRVHHDITTRTSASKFSARTLDVPSFSSFDTLQQTNTWWSINVWLTGPSPLTHSYSGKKTTNHLHLLHNSGVECGGERPMLADTRGDEAAIETFEGALKSTYAHFWSSGESKTGMGPRGISNHTAITRDELLQVCKKSLHALNHLFFARSRLGKVPERPSVS